MLHFVDLFHAIYILKAVFLFSFESLHMRKYRLGVGVFYVRLLPFNAWARTLLCKSVRGFKDTLWVLRHDEPLVHVSVDISLITKHILDHVISLEI